MTRIQFNDAVTLIGTPGGDNRRLKMLIYSPAGHGKTTLLGTAQDDERTNPILILDYEGGVGSLVGRRSAIDGKEVAVATIRSMNDYESILKYLKSGDHPYKSIGVDSLSEAHMLALMSRLDPAISGRTRKNEDQLDENDYGIVLTQMRRFMRDFRNLPMHVIYTALAKETSDVREGLIKKPALPGQFAEDVLGIPEVVGYLATTQLDEGETARVLVLQNYPKIRSKARMPYGITAPNEIMNPTITDILDCLRIQVDGDHEDGSEDSN